MAREEAWKILIRYKKKLTKQQAKTIAGQIEAGFPDEAVKGIYTLLGKR